MALVFLKFKGPYSFQRWITMCIFFWFEKHLVSSNEFGGRGKHLGFSLAAAVLWKKQYWVDGALDQKPEVNQPFFRTESLRPWLWRRAALISKGEDSWATGFWQVNLAELKVAKFQQVTTTMFNLVKHSIGACRSLTSTLTPRVYVCIYIYIWIDILYEYMLIRCFWASSVFWICWYDC